jgi:hypothetical protein
MQTNADDQISERRMFLKANLEDSMFWLHLRLFSYGENGWTQIPPHNLAMQSKHVLLLDCHTIVFLWIGKLVDKVVVQKAEGDTKIYLENIGLRKRFPHPLLMRIEVNI